MKSIARRLAVTPLMANHAIQNNSMDSINKGVIAKLKARAERGHSKYGVTMDRTDLNPQQWLTHAQEEAMDLAVYLEKLIRLNGVCKWGPTWEGGQYPTGCDNVFEFTNDGIKENDFEFCPYCGRKIEEVKL